MIWWIWIIFGCVLLVAELMTPGGFYLLFFGISAVTVGLLQLVGLAGPDWVQWLLFSVISIASIAFLRRPLVEKFSAQGLGAGSPTVDTDSLVGEVAVASELFAAGTVGRVEMRGTTWTAVNRGDQPILAGQRCVVQKVEGLKLEVLPEPQLEPAVPKEN